MPTNDAYVLRVSFSLIDVERLICSHLGQQFLPLIVDKYGILLNLISVCLLYELSFLVDLSYDGS